jgi:hypothetical protein
MSDPTQKPQPQPKPKDDLLAPAEPKRAPSGQTPDPHDLRGRERQEGWAVPLDRIEAFTSGAAIAVEPDRIEQELSALWRKAAERAQSSGGRLAVARACLWNFIVHSDGEQAFRSTKRVLDEVSETLPARIIAVHETQDGGGSDVVGADGAPLRAYVEANYRKVTGRREVVAEEITLEADRQQSQRLPGLVRSLLLADVPTALFIRNPVAECQWLPRLARDAERFVFDSGSVTSAQALLQIANVLRRLFPPEGGAEGGALPVELADLGWLRLWPWRALIASLFDNPPAAASLSGLTEIEIAYAEGAEPGALLLAGWLMGRLRLLLGDGPAPDAGQAPPGSTFALKGSRPGSRPVTLRLMQGPAQATAVGPVGINHVTLRAGDQVYTASGTVDTATPCIVLHSPHAPERVQPVQGRRDAELLVAAMGVGGRDPLMYEALRLGARLARRRCESGVAGRGEEG